MTSQNNLRYLPFWVLYEYIGDTPPEPFIPVYVIKNYVRNANSPEGQINYDAVDIGIYKPDSDLVATNIPLKMLIDPDELSVWAGQIANWFTDHADLICNQESTDGNN